MSDVKISEYSILELNMDGYQAIVKREKGKDPLVGIRDMGAKQCSGADELPFSVLDKIVSAIKERLAFEEEPDSELALEDPPEAKP